MTSVSRPMDDVNEEKDVFQSYPKILEETILNYRNDVNHVAQLKVDLCFVDIALHFKTYYGRFIIVWAFHGLAFMLLLPPKITEWSTNNENMI